MTDYIDLLDEPNLREDVPWSSILAELDQGDEVQAVRILVRYLEAALDAARAEQDAAGTDDSAIDDPRHGQADALNG